MEPFAQPVGGNDVDELIDTLCDPARRLPTVLAAIPLGVASTAWTEHTLSTAIRHLPGLAVIYVVTPKASAAFNRALEFHQVFRGASAPTCQASILRGPPMLSGTR